MKNTVNAKKIMMIVVKQRRLVLAIVNMHMTVFVKILENAETQHAANAKGRLLFKISKFIKNNVVTLAISARSANTK